MDLYLTHQPRRAPAPLTVALVAVLGLLVWLVTAQGQAAAYAGSDCPNETACRLEYGFATDGDVEGDDDEGSDDTTGDGADDDTTGGGGAVAGDGTDDTTENGGGAGTDDTTGEGGGGETDDTTGDGETGAGATNDTDDTTGGNNPGGNNPGGNTPTGGTPSGGAVLGSTASAGTGGVLPNTAMTPANDAGPVAAISGLLVLAALGLRNVRSALGVRRVDR